MQKIIKVKIVPLYDERAEKDNKMTDKFVDLLYGFYNNAAYPFRGQS